MSQKAKRPESKNEHLPEINFSIYSDGGCRFNPGGPGGYGTIVIDHETGEISEYSEGFFSTTNNRMELMAALVGLRSVPEGSSICLYSDSKYLLNTIENRFSKKKNIDLWNKLDAAMKNKKVYTQWVKGHAGDELNERCDEMATQAMNNPSREDSEYTESHPFSHDKKSRNHNDKTGKTGSMGVKIKIPQEIRQYSGDSFKVKDDCANMIQSLNTRNRTALRFRDFSDLKTGGIDGCSRLDSQQYVSQEVVEIVSHIVEQEDVKSCLRWYMRGLDLDLAIRKALVDAEIRQNAIGKRKK